LEVSTTSTEHPDTTTVTGRTMRKCPRSPQDHIKESGRIGSDNRAIADLKDLRITVPRKRERIAIRNNDIDRMAIARRKERDFT
jgi:hypothetical protein